LLRARVASGGGWLQPFRLRAGWRPRREWACCSPLRGRACWLPLRGRTGIKGLPADGRSARVGERGRRALHGNTVSRSVGGCRQPGGGSRPFPRMSDRQRRMTSPVGREVCELGLSPIYRCDSRSASIDDAARSRSRLEPTRSRCGRLGRLRRLGRLGRLGRLRRLRRFRRLRRLQAWISGCGVCGAEISGGDGAARPTRRGRSAWRSRSGQVRWRIGLEQNGARRATPA
jgi:hypothetical protein